MSAFLQPRAIQVEDCYNTFECGEPSLDEWITARAVRNERGRASRTFVSIDRDSGLVAGYYCLSSSSLRTSGAPGALKRNMPDPIPIILLGRLAVDTRFKGQSLGVSLLQHAFLKSVEASRIVGAKALIVHAISDSAETFYKKFGFKLVPESSRAMYVLMDDAEATIASQGPS